HPLPVELEGGAPPQHDIQLLVRLVRLVVLVDDSVARLTGGPRVDSEGRDAEVVPDGSPWFAPVVDLVDLVEVRDRATTHETSFTSSSLDTRRSLPGESANACASALPPDSSHSPLCKTQQEMGEGGFE